MKKSISLAISLVLIVFFAGCGSQNVSLTEFTQNGITISVPDDMGQFTDNSGSKVASGPNCSIVITARTDADVKRSEWTNDSYKQVIAEKFSNVSITSFDNNATIGGIGAVRISYTADKSTGENMTCTSVMLYLEDEQFQMVQFTCMTGKDSSLEKNLEAVIASIKQA